MDISAIASTASAASSLAGLILAIPNSPKGYQPQNDPVIDGSTEQLDPPILFHYEGEQSVTLESDITDHYVENNSSIQDQISLKPIMIVTHGFIGELTNTPPNQYFRGLKLAADKLTVVGGYLPQLSVSALASYNTALQLYNTAQTAKNAAVAAWTSTPNLSLQEKCYLRFYGYWLNRRLFTVQTPWALYDNCAIKSLRAIQAEDTTTITDFEITFKQIQFARVKTTYTATQSTSDLFGRSANQGASEQDFGSQNLSTDPESFTTVMG
jgi:hypothetical protein